MLWGKREARLPDRASDIKYRVRLPSLVFLSESLPQLLNERFVLGLVILIVQCGHDESSQRGLVGGLRIGLIRHDGIMNPHA